MGKWLGKLRGADVSGGQAGGTVIKDAGRQPEPMQWIEARVVDRGGEGCRGRRGVWTVKVHLAGGQIIDVVIPDAVEPEWLARLAQGLDVP